MKKAISLATVAALVLACSVQAFAAAGYGPGTEATTAEPYEPATTTTTAAPAGAVTDTAVNTAVNNAVRAAATTEGTSLAVSLKNVDVVNTSSMKKLADAAVAAAEKANKTDGAVLNFDQTKGKTVTSRITVPADVAAGIKGSFKTEISTDAKVTQKTVDLVGKVFGKEATVASMSQKGVLPGAVNVAVLFEKLPANPVAYVLYKNVMYQVPVTVDANGYAYVTTQVMGDLIITDGAVK